MNKETRKRIGAVVKLLEEAQGKLDAAYADTEEIRDEEDEKLQNVPENLQGTERYAAAEEAVDGLIEAADTIEEIQTSVDDLIERLNEIIGG